MTKSCFVEPTSQVQSKADKPPESCRIIPIFRQHIQVKRAEINGLYWSDVGVVVNDVRVGVRE